jgi:hypothetical protein
MLVTPSNVTLPRLHAIDAFGRDVIRKIKSRHGGRLPPYRNLARTINRLNCRVGLASSAKYRLAKIDVHDDDAVWLLYPDCELMRDELTCAMIILVPPIQGMAAEDVLCGFVQFLFELFLREINGGEPEYLNRALDNIIEPCKYAVALTSGHKAQAMQTAYECLAVIGIEAGVVPVTDLQGMVRDLDQIAHAGTIWMGVHSSRYGTIEFVYLPVLWRCRD